MDRTDTNSKCNMLVLKYTKTSTHLVWTEHFMVPTKSGKMLFVPGGQTILQGKTSYPCKYFEAKN